MEPIVATRVIEPSLSPASRGWRIPLAIFAAGGVFGALAALAFSRYTAAPPMLVVQRQCYEQRFVVHDVTPQPRYQYLMFDGPDVRVRVLK